MEKTVCTVEKPEQRGSRRQLFSNRDSGDKFRHCRLRRVYGRFFLYFVRRGGDFAKLDGVYGGTVCAEVEMQCAKRGKAVCFHPKNDGKLQLSHTGIRLVLGGRQPCFHGVSFGDGHSDEKRMVYKFGRILFFSKLFAGRCIFHGTSSQTSGERGRRIIQKGADT